MPKQYKMIIIIWKAICYHRNTYFEFYLIYLANNFLFWIIKSIIIKKYFMKTWDAFILFLETGLMPLIIFYH